MSRVVLIAVLACLRTSAAVRQDAAVLESLLSVAEVEEKPETQSVMLEADSRKMTVMESIQLAWGRACVSEVALRHTEATKEFRTAQDEDLQVIKVALESLWSAEDAVQSHFTWAGRKRRLDAEKAVEGLGLNLKAARKNCEKQKTLPIQAAIQECVSSVASSGKTRRGGWHKMHYVKGHHEADLAGADGNITALVGERFELAWGLEFLSSLSSTELRRTPAARKSIEEKKRRLAAAEQSIKEFRFSVKHTWAYCEHQHEEDTPQAQEVLLKRVAAELEEAAERVKGQCQELEDSTCPEGTSPQNIRQYDEERAAKVGAATFLLWKPVGLPLAGTTAFLIGGPVLSMQVMAFYAFPAWSFLGSSLIASISGLPWQADCRCAVNHCEYDEELNACTLKPSGKSSNKYQWMPYPGSKCVAMPGTGRPQCTLAPCSSQDVKRSGHVSSDSMDAELFGTFGVVRSEGEAAGVHNCLSTDGTLKGVLAMASELPRSISNTPANRVELYERLQPLRPEHA